MGIKIRSKRRSIFLHHAATNPAGTVPTTSNGDPGGSEGSDPDGSDGSSSGAGGGGSGSRSEPSPQGSM